MNLSTLTAIVGPINRGQLETGFQQEEVTVDKRRGRSLNPASAVPEVPPLTEDLSRFRLQPKIKLSREEMLRRARPEMRPIYGSLIDRGECVENLAIKIGISASTVARALAGQMSHGTRRALIPHLTDAELGMLGWTR